MTRRGSCVKLNDDYTLARVPSLCPLPFPLRSPLLFLVYSFFSVCPLRGHFHINDSIARFSFVSSRQTRRGGCFTQSVAIIEYPPARPSRSNDRSNVLARIAARVFARARRISAGTCLGKGIYLEPQPAYLTAYRPSNHLPPRRAGQKSANRHQSRRIRENGSRGNAHICASFPSLPPSLTLSRARAHTRVFSPRPRARPFSASRIAS